LSINLCRTRAKMDSTAEWDDVWLKCHAVNAKRVRHYFDVFKFSHVPKNMSIIDIGCGSGEALKMLKAQGYKSLHGIEPESRLFEKGDMIQQGDILELKLKQQYDIVLIFGVLHHLATLDEIKRALHNVKAILKRRGKFYNVEQWPNLVRSVAMKLVRDTPFGLLSPMLRTERKLLELERVNLGHWLKVESQVTKYAQEIGLEVVFFKKELRCRYIIFEKVKD
jgi:SAM-dependent methyltransferase